MPRTIRPLCRPVKRRDNEMSLGCVPLPSCLVPAILFQSFSLLLWHEDNRSTEENVCGQIEGISVSFLICPQKGCEQMDGILSYQYMREVESKGWWCGVWDLIPSLPTSTMNVAYS